MTESEQTVVRFTLGAHEVVVRAAEDGTLSLWLDDCLRKRRGPGMGPVYLWTNVELPFEDHHLVEVRRGAAHAPVLDADRDPAPQPDLDIRINGAPMPVIEATI